MLNDLVYAFVLVVYTTCAFLSGAAFSDPEDDDGRSSARCVFWPITIFAFLALLFFGIRT